ncbi:hypothetical protein Bcep1808_2122 [Burkholderia vietnamiensis G4]|uniref:Uncharacterized protein n=1 Tax=Burkholderia vietnamiensis (strain G4 / LMG 22486) TaxID=269482 RepID=A4JFS1_BURVG|nr:hypothetical protein Bcep1808_2122 [Burkholderia vietnamiensis G4]
MRPGSARLIAGVSENSRTIKAQQKQWTRRARRATAAPRYRRRWALSSCEPAVHPGGGAHSSGRTLASLLALRNAAWGLNRVGTTHPNLSPPTGWRADIAPTNGPEEPHERRGFAIDEDGMRR